jgi:pimeloyl-ACP methyl ester carboxylesterase/DNA-binding CsgD family transcriptional regulator
MAKANSTDPEALKALVLSIARGDEEYDHLLNALEPSIITPSPPDTDLALALALSLESVEQQAALNDRLYELSADKGAPALILSSTGQVLGHNPAANLLLGDILSQGIAKLGIRSSDFYDFKNRVLNNEGPSLLRIFRSRDADESMIYIGHFQARHHVFFLRALEVQWPESINLALKELFNLTDAECDVLACLARGMQTPKIGEYRQSKVSTIRQQIKSLLQKLGLSSQVQATALAAALASQSQENISQQKTALTDQLINDTLSMVSASHPTLRARLDQNELIHQTRQVGWRRFGKKGGKPVLLMHSGYFGAGESEQERALAYESGFDIIVVERPGFGRSQPPLRNEPALDTHLADCLAVLDTVAWSNMSLISHDYGFVPALALANRCPERVNGLLAISPLPLQHTESELKDIPHQQRVFIWAAQHAFWMIRLLLRLGHVKARKLGPGQWMDMVFEGTPDELAIFHTLGGKEVATGSYHFNLAQNSKGQELDMQVSIADDWSDLLRKVNVPLKGLVGLNNITFSPTGVHRLSSVNPEFSVRTVDNAGLTLSITHMPLCYKSMQSLFT